MSSEERNFGLDVASLGGETTAQVVVDWVRGYAASSGAAALSARCTRLADFESEVARLRSELEELVEQVKPVFGQAPTPPRDREDTEASATRPTRIARLATDLTVEDVMVREVRTMGRNDPLKLADELMKQGRFRHVVVMEDETPVGVISQRDIFHGALAWSLGQGGAAHEKALASMPAKQVMQTGVVTIGPQTPLADAAARMREHGVGCLPVVEGDELVGILTEGDFLSLVAS